MQAIDLVALRRMEPTTAEQPRIQRDNDVLLKVEQVGVCGSDVHYYETGRIGSMEVQFPFRLGHEFSGTVVEVGRAVDRVRVGDQVAVDPAMPCFQCDQCLAGRENTCRNLKFLACPGQAQGCLGEYIVMPQESCFPTNGKINLAQAVLCEPLSIGIYAVQQSGLKAGDSIAILGAGPIGLCVMVAAQAVGASTILVTEKIADRIAIAKGGGAAWVGNPDKENVVAEVVERSGGGVNVVFECAGQQDTIDNGIAMLKPGGKLMIIGIPREKRLSFEIETARRQELTLINVRRQNNCVQAAIDLVASAKVPVDYIMTHRFPLERTGEAFEMVAHYRDGVIKALIEV